MAKSREQAIKSVKKRIVPVADIDPYLKVLLYGRNGKGKTRTAVSLPRTIVLDVNEKGTKSVRRSGADVFSAKTWEDITYLYWYLRQGEHEYDTVVLDTLTQMQHLCMATVLKIAEDRDPNRPAKTPDMRAWGQMAERMKPMLLDFRNLPMNVVMIAQVRKDRAAEEDDSPDSKLYVPDLSPGVRATALACVDVIGYIHQRQVRFVKKSKNEKEKPKTTTKWETRMLVGPHDDFETKDRTGRLGHIVRNPNMQKMLDAAFSDEE